MPSTSRLTFLRLLFILALALFGGLGAASAALNPQEQALANLFTNASGQHRPFTTLDPILSLVARQRAADMAQRHYFGHINPDGHGANYLVEQAGYKLPDTYPNDGNNLESIAAGQTSAAQAWGDFMGSSGHKTHLLAENSFYAAQTSYGIGYYSGGEYLHYWVIITAPPAIAQPGIAILSPAANAAVASSNLTVTGSTTGATAAASVQVRVENGNGTGAYVTASGTANWNAALSGLAPGENIIRARSLNSAGALLKEAARTVRLVAMRPLTVTFAGQGTLTAGFAGVTSREVGRSYSIVATPAPGWNFAGWSGGISGAAPALTFTMREGLALTANFIPNPFVSRKGFYNGLIRGDTTANNTSGLFRLTLASSGAFSGRIVFGGTAHTFTGRFDISGRALVKVIRAGKTPLTLNLQADVSGDSGRIQGTVFDGTLTAQLSADRAQQPGTAPSALAGRYTMVLPPNAQDTDPALPQGNGYATVIVDTLGKATVAAVLADGKKFSYAGFISKTGTLPIYAPLYDNLGSVSGQVTFGGASGSDLDGAFHWSKPERLLDLRHKPAFELDEAIVGSRYVAPVAGTRVMEVEDAVNNSEFLFGEGNLTSEVLQPATLEKTNKVVMVAPTLKSMNAVVAPATGRFTGTFIHPVTQLATTYHGVILQNQNGGYGLFMGKDRSGYASFTPAE